MFFWEIKEHVLPFVFLYTHIYTHTESSCLYMIIELELLVCLSWFRTGPLLKFFDCWHHKWTCGLIGTHCLSLILSHKLRGESILVRWGQELIMLIYCKWEVGAVYLNCPSWFIVPFVLFVVLDFPIANNHRLFRLDLSLRINLLIIYVTRISQWSRIK